MPGVNRKDWTKGMRFYSRACRLQLLLGQLLILIILVPELMVVAQDEVPITGDWGKCARMRGLGQGGSWNSDLAIRIALKCSHGCDLETGVRSAECTVRKIRTGAGKACPERKISKCDVNCREDVFFGEWSKCPEGGGERIQTRGIRRFARNNGRQCVVENRQTCTDCRVSYGNWSACDTSQPGLPKMSRKVTMRSFQQTVATNARLKVSEASSMKKHRAIAIAAVVIVCDRDSGSDSGVHRGNGKIWQW